MSSIGRVPNLVSSQNLSTPSGSPVATVQAGETELSQVAQRLGVNTGDLAAANPHISDPAKLTAGQDIVLPQNVGTPVASPQSAGNSVTGSNSPQSPLGDPLTKSFIQADLAAKTLSRPAGPPAGSPAAFDSYLNLGGIQGESTVGKAEGWIEVSSFSHGEANTGNPTGATGKEANVGNPLPPPEKKAAFNAFVNFGDIKGESTDKGHKDWIEVSSFGHGEANTGNPTGATGKEANVGNPLPPPEKKAAFNAFVNFGDIKGESTDKDHKDWVELSNYTHEAIDPQSIALPAPGSTPKK